MGFVSACLAVWSGWAVEPLPFSLNGEFLRADQGSALGFLIDLQGAGTARVFTNISTDKAFEFFAKLEHLRFSDFDILATLESKGEIVRAPVRQGAFIQGTAHAKGVLFNSKPVYDLQVYYELLPGENAQRGYVLKIPFLKWGNCLGYGEFKLKKEPALDLFLTVDGADLKELESLFDLKKIKEFFPFLADCEQASLSGSLEIHGPLKSPYVSGRLEVIFRDRPRDKDKKLVFNFKGNYPFLKIEDSFFKQSDDAVFSMRGDLDLDKFSGSDPLDQLEYFIRPSGNRSVVLPSERADRTMIRLSTSASTPLEHKGSEYNLVDSSVGFRRDKDSIELEHGLRGQKEALMMYLKEGEEIIGLERKVRF